MPLLRLLRFIKESRRRIHVVQKFRLPFSAWGGVSFAGHIVCEKVYGKRKNTDGGLPSAAEPVLLLSSSRSPRLGSCTRCSCVWAMLVLMLCFFCSLFRLLFAHYASSVVGCLVFLSTRKGRGRRLEEPLR